MIFDDERDGNVSESVDGKRVRIACIFVFVFVFVPCSFCDYCVSVVRLLSHLLFIVYYYLHLRSRPHPTLSPVDVFLFAAYITFLRLRL